MTQKKSLISVLKVIGIVVLASIVLRIIYPPLLFISIYLPGDLWLRYEQSNREDRRSRLVKAKLKQALLKATGGEPLAQLFIADNIDSFYSKDPQFIKLMAENNSSLTTKAQWELYWIEQSMSNNYGPAFCYKSRLGSTVKYDYPDEDRELWLKKAVELGNPKSLSAIILWKYYLSNGDYRKATDVLIRQIRKMIFHRLFSYPTNILKIRYCFRTL